MIRSHRRLPRSAAALLLSALSATILLLFPLAGAAQDKAVALDRPRLAQAPEPLCFCWSDGKKIAEGSMACIRTTMGRRLATCGRVINMMSWEVTENPCPES
jgi:hypothetical protein